MKFHAMRAAVKFPGLICFLLLSLFLVTGAAHAQTVTTQTALQAALLARQSSQPADAPTDPVFDFYAARAFAPAWTGSAAAEDTGAAVLFTLGHADRHGLRPQEYGEASSRWDAPPAEGVEAAAYELNLTTDLLHYANDVRQGRVRPSQVYKDVVLPIRLFDFATSLNRALKARGIEVFLADLPPQQSEYQGLVMALVSYRRLAENGGWPPIPGKGEIALAPNGKDARLRALILRLALEDPLLAGSDLGPEDVRAAVMRFQVRNGISADGRVGVSTLTALNIPVAARIAQIVANMERWRWMPRSLESRYISVNVPDQAVEFVVNGDVALQSRAIVGRLTSKTPITRMMASQLVVNPPWHVPDDIAAAAILPKLRASPNYLATRNMVLVDGPADDPHGLKIDWRKVKTMPYMVDQNPGTDSAMGVLMLDSPNDFGVYLHDTPGKALFKADMRLKSNGCVRVEQMIPLASLILAGDPQDDQVQGAIASGETQRLRFETQLPIYLVYWTAIAAADGRVGFRPDLYGRDKPLIAALAAPRRPAS
ncbi:MAG TPA: L,D-transpeptidase family protein [Rhizomicrobium sp.]